METTSVAIKMPSTVFTNRQIAVGKDLVFQWVLLTVDDDNQQQWLPLDQLEKDVLNLVRQNVLDPVFPDELRAYVASLPTLPNRRVPSGI
jgi:hypothetical protein